MRKAYLSVFSACAEVVPKGVPGEFNALGILRVRGGSSDSETLGRVDKPYSPRARR